MVLKCIPCVCIREQIYDYEIFDLHYCFKTIVMERT